MPTIMGPDPTVGSPLGVVPQTVVAQQKMPRSDRLEVGDPILYFLSSVVRCVSLCATILEHISRWN